MPKAPPPLDVTQLALPISLLRTRELVMERFRPLLLARGVTEQQWRVLRVLEEVKSADASTVADHACLMLPSLTRIIRTLSDAGWVDSHKDPEDGRRTLLEITSDGRAFLADAAHESAAIYNEIEAAIGPDTLETLQTLLVTVRRALKETD
ncbi:MAG: homoprotocatechuate degradation operon regulator HpaR [Aliishimia sp.]